MPRGAKAPTLRELRARWPGDNAAARGSHIASPRGWSELARVCETRDGESVRYCAARKRRHNAAELRVMAALRELRARRRGDNGAPRGSHIASHRGWSDLPRFREPRDVGSARCRAARQRRHKAALRELGVRWRGDNAAPRGSHITFPRGWSELARLCEPRDDGRARYRAARKRRHEAALRELRARGQATREKDSQS